MQHSRCGRNAWRSSGRCCENENEKPIKNQNESPKKDQNEARKSKHASKTRQKENNRETLEANLQQKMFKKPTEMQKKWAKPTKKANTKEWKTDRMIRRTW